MDFAPTRARVRLRPIAFGTAVGWDRADGGVAVGDGVWVVSEGRAFLLRAFSYSSDRMLPTLGKTTAKVWSHAVDADVA